MPWYSEEDDLVVRFKPYFKLGGIFHTAFHLYFMRFHIWNDFIGSELVLADFAGFVDIMTYRQFCFDITAENYNMRMITHVQIDFNECMFGMFGIFINDLIDCEWRQYWIDVPLVNEGLPEYDGSWTFIPKNCIDAGDFELFN